MSRKSGCIKKEFKNMFETDEKKQLFANWLWQVANADGNIAKEEVQILNNIGMSLGLKEIKYKKN